MLIGPNSCAYCGGEYGEHEADCTRPQAEPMPVQSVPFERGRRIILTHYEFEDHQQVDAQWAEKTVEDGGELWQGTAATLREACHKAIDAMLGNDLESERADMSTDTAWKISVQSGQKDSECVLRIHDTRYTGQFFLITVRVFEGKQFIPRHSVQCENGFLIPANDMIDMLITVSQKFLGIFGAFVWS